MKKTLITALSTAAVATMAMPALADHTIGGYARTNFVMEQFGEGKNTAINQKEDPTANTVVNERIRARWQNNINEYVSVVLFGEVDTDWGLSGKGGDGGKQGSDATSLEIKHAYIDVKVPNTPVAVRLGAQPISDGQAFSGVIMDDDMSGARVDVKTDMATVTAGWAKLDEGSLNSVDDSDLYLVQAALEPVKGLKLMPQAWWSVNKKFNAEKWFTGSTDTTNVRNSEYYLGLGASFALPMVNVSGWFLYDGGKAEGRDAGSDDLKVSAWAASAKAEATVAGAKVGLRGLYFPKQSKNIFEDDEEGGLKGNAKRTFFLPPNMNNGAAEFSEEGSLIFLADTWMTNTSSGRVALVDAAYTGMGLAGVVLSGSFTPPALPQLYAKASAGYYTALTKNNDKSWETRVAGDDRGGKALGTEVAAMVGYKIADKVDVSLRGGYAFLGSFYDETNDAGEDPDNIYKVALSVNVPY